MLPSNRRHAGKSHKIWNAVLLLGLFLLLSACGKGEARSAAVDIKRAEWRGERVVISGGWARGISTPPTCRILEDLDGPASNYFEPDARVSLDGNTFSKEFVPKDTARRVTSPDYYVRCTVSLDSGRSADDAVKVKDAP